MTKNLQSVKNLVIKNILVPFDNSRYSISAFKLALDMAKKYNASILTLSIIRSNCISNSFLDFDPHQECIDKEALADLNTSFESLKSMAFQFSVPLKSEIKVSTAAAEAILSYSSSHRVDLIVMGTRGRGGYKKFMLGSISLEISQKAACPVILIK